MSFSTKKKQLARKRRHYRVRKHVRGTAVRPRLAVFRSNKHVTAQVIDDSSGRTLERAQAAGITKVVFDRGGNLYHGRVAAVADAAREAGLEF